MRNLVFIIAITVILFSCRQKHDHKTEQQSEQSTETVISSKVENLPPLEEGEFTVTEKDFGEAVELHGTTHPVDSVFFEVKECEMIVNDSVLIIKNQNNAEMFMAFSLPDFRFIRSFGAFGRGPGEFQFPGLVKDESGQYLCFIYEKTNNHLYALTSDLEIIELPVVLQKGERTFNDKQLYGISSNEFLYVESIPKGKAIFSARSENDTMITTLIKNLAFSDKHKNWAAYIGDFGVNGKKNRAVFAYKYFKRLIFTDLESGISKTVIFDIPAETKKEDAVSMLDPSNITHYWGMSSNDKFVYVLYSGRTPIDVSKENNKSSGYIYVEKFDWNGNPVSKHKLDHWGYFCINEQENTIYLTSVTDEHPLISYKLPAE